MVLIKEYRIPLPLALDEYARGQLYMIAKASREETTGEEGIEVLKNEEFKDEKGKGIFTLKHIHLTKKLPDWVKRLFPFIGNVLKIEEKSWNRYPYSRTEYTCNLFGDKLKITVETRHKEDAGDTDNVFNLDKATLSKRVVEFVDIADNSKVDDKSYKEEEDPNTYVSQKAKRGPLPKNWRRKVKPVMCAYKLVTVDFQYRTFKSKIENLIHDVISPIYLKTHRQAYCWLDEWFDLSFEDIRKMDVQVAHSLKENFESKRASGTKGQQQANRIARKPAADGEEEEEPEPEPEPEPTPAKSRFSRLTGRLRARM